MAFMRSWYNVGRTGKFFSKQEGNHNKMENKTSHTK